MRHLLVCPQCYRVWLEVAQAAGGPPSVLRRPFCSARTLVYAGGALAAAICLAVFLYLPRPHEESIFRQQAAPPAMVNEQKSESGSSSREEPHPPPAPLAAGGLAATAGDAAKSGDLSADTRQQAASAEGNKVTAGAAANEHKTATEPPAAKQNGSIRIGAVEMRRSELAVWYDDLREMCRLPNFLPDQWNSLHARGIDILQAMSGNSQEEEIDRLWLMLGQMEGLTLERRKSFCAWSDKELARRQKKKE
jgi:hypothetical protein